MPNDNANTQKFEAPAASDPAQGAADQMMQLVHNLRWQCRDGVLVPKPTDCGDYSSRPNMSNFLPPLQVG